MVRHPSIGDLEHPELVARLRAFRWCRSSCCCSGRRSGTRSGSGSSRPGYWSFTTSISTGSSCRHCAPRGSSLIWLDVSLLLTLAFTCGAIVAQACQTRPLVPIGDPRLPESLAFRNS